MHQERKVSLQDCYIQCIGVAVQLCYLPISFITTNFLTANIYNTVLITICYRHIGGPINPALWHIRRLSSLSTTLLGRQVTQILHCFMKSAFKIVNYAATLCVLMDKLVLGKQYSSVWTWYEVDGGCFEVIT